MSDSYFRVGDQVIVNGWGIGTVKQVGVEHLLDPERWVIIEETSDCLCDCGNRHKRTRRTTAHVMHVGLTAGELDRREAKAASQEQA